MNKTFRFIFSGLCIFWSLAPGVVQAFSVSPPTRSPEATLQALKSQSGLVVSGVVIAFTSKYVANEAKKSSPPIIYTEVILAPTSVFKGEIEETFVQFTVPGGCIQEDNICFSSDLYPTFKTGEKTLLFLKKGPTGAWVFSDFIYGKQPFVDQNGRFENGKAPLDIDFATFERVLGSGLPRKVW